MIYTARVTKGHDGTRLEWVDSDYRFFPTLRDAVFGYVLQPADLAMNKVTAAAGRRELRDLVDLVTIHETILPLGAVVWAAVEKSPGFRPEGLITEIRRNSLGLLFLKDGNVVQPDPCGSGSTRRTRGRGVASGRPVLKFPTAMLERYKGQVAAIITASDEAG